MERSNNILITGADGQLGRALQDRAPEKVRVYSANRKELDITDQRAVFKAVKSIRPTWIINAAAYTSVDQAEKEHELAFRVNADGPEYLAQAADAVGARMVHLSTDFVFDGRKASPYEPDDEPNPINVYGETKLAGELRVQNVLGNRSLILRTAWLCAGHGDNFVHTMLHLMRKRDVIQVVDDQIGTPTEAGGLARAVWSAINRELSGTHHWTHSGMASWYDFAVAIHEEAYSCGLLTRSIDIEPVPANAYPTPAKRPACSVLDKQRTWKALGQKAEHWRVALRQMLQAKFEKKRAYA
jgi:dTDP-4-dehydrorhamnose reductase